MLEEAIANIRAAIEAGRTDILRTLIEACEQCEQADAEHVTKDRVLSGLWTPEGTLLHMATRLGRPDVVRALLYAGADPGVQNADGDTAVHLSASDTMRSVYTDELFKATAQSNEGRVCQLLAAGLGINAWDSPLSRNTPLHWAANFADRDMITCLAEIAS
ncbi:poly [ADP-ribose] polymerase tankyrase-1-like [Pollicipes pollicipes]|uniref:poly [ADP-ribose] polymerase tankyrase-1-like n=1 Tax=Pollicipes pollicipes TaxID=41117 RepID=UPI001884EB1F|nr:poly [ADP-ribose] polymerase tankyrase-1-like [Pollicipes pollicipes]